MFVKSTNTKTIVQYKIELSSYITHYLIFKALLLKYIGDNAFENCSLLDNIILPNNITQIGEAVFLGCISIYNIELSFNLKSIPKFTFKDCTSLNNIYIPSSVNEIDEYAFSGCTGLKKIYIHQCVSSILPNAFDGCTNLQEVEGINLDILSKDNLNLAFGDTPWFKNKFV